MDEQGEDEMAHRRGKVIRKKKLSRTEQPDLVSKVSQSQNDPGYDFEISPPLPSLFAANTGSIRGIYVSSVVNSCSHDYVRIISGA